MAAEPPIFAEVGRLGFAIPLAAFRARVGGEPALRKILKALSVTEKPGAGRTRGMALQTLPAWRREADTLYVPRVRGAMFLAARTRAGVPLLDGVRDGVGANAPLPPPRRLAPERLASAAPFYLYQEAAIRYLCAPAAPLAPAAAPPAAVAPVAPHGGAVTPPRSTYLQMDTGLGKSRVGFGVIARRGAPALVVVPTDAIAGQWLDEGAALYPRLVVGIYRNVTKANRRAPAGPATHDVVVVIINTFREKAPDFLAGYGTVIFDEAHEYYSAHNRQALWLAQAGPDVLGLSATPCERPDGLDRYVPLLLGPVLYPRDIPGFDIGDVHFRGAVRLVEYAGDPAHCETALSPAGTMSAILTLGNVIRDRARARLVAAEVDRLARLHEGPDAAALGLGPRPPEAATPAHPAGAVRRHGVFVFAEHREYLPALRAALLERLPPEAVLAPELGPVAAPPGEAPPAVVPPVAAVVPPVAAVVPPAVVPAPVAAAAAPPGRAVTILRGGVARSAVGDARAAGAHVVLTTYGFSRRGISLPDMTAIVLATPRRNGSRQILGRILRRGSDESILRQVVDIVDVRTGLRGQAADRRAVYREKNYPITKCAASFEAYAPADPALDAALDAALVAAVLPGAAALAAEDDPDADLRAMTLEDLLGVADADAAAADANADAA